VGAKHKASVNNFAGLVTAYGQLGAPPGSFSQADNVDLPNTSMLEKRRGWGSIGATNVGVPAALALAEPIGSPTGHIIGNMAANTATAAAASLYDYDASAAITTPGALTHANDVTTRMKSAVMGGNTYLTTQNGVVRLEVDGSAWWAGLPTPFLELAALPTGSAWLAAGSSVAYRVVAVQTDASGREIPSPPSGRVVAHNTSGSGVSPSLIAGQWFSENSGVAPSGGTTTRYDVYRSAASTTGVPSDEMQLCYSAKSTGATGIYFVDQCPEACLGAYLYTNAISGGDTVQNGVSVGLAARNDAPPVAADLAVFANRLWFAGLIVPQELTFSIVAVGTSGTALKSGDAITIGGQVFSAGYDFVVATSGSITENIRATAEGLVYAIYNRSSTTGGLLFAEYTGNESSPGTIGRIRVRALTKNRAAFTAQLTTGGSGASFLPDLTSALASKSEKWLNGLAYSKDSQPDAVPPVNYIRVGRGDVAIKRIIALRDSLFVFAADGIWRVTGNDPSNFSLDRFDTTFTLLARDTAVVLDDAIYAWGSEGIARITTSGVTLIDAPIRDIVAQQRIAGVSTAWSVADRIRKRVLFYLPNHSSTACALGSVSNRALVYHAAAGGRWTRYDWGAANAKTCAIALAPSDAQQLVAGNADDGAGTVTAGTETDGPGYTRATGTRYGHGLARERFANASTDWADVDNTGAAAAITSTVRWTNATPDPQLVAQWTEAAALFAPSDTVALMGSPSALTFGFRTEMTPTEQTVAWSRPTAPYINSQARVMVPRDAARGSRMFFSLTHSIGSDGATKEYFAVDGFGLWYELDGREVSR